MIEPKSNRPLPCTYRTLPDKPGCYLVTTISGTQYLFNREQLTVTRIPVSGSTPSINDGIRRLRTVESCSVGEAGFWTMRSGDPDVDFYWQATSPVVSITLATPEPATRSAAYSPEES